ncbi:TatD family hydrolase [Dehalococcoidia bacterium]|nr:TatD family hydrolase [Dehalococcoidia bacterium]
MLADCHTHLYSFSDTEIHEILERARVANVGPVVVAGTTLDSSARSVELTNKHGSIFAGIGVHPMDLIYPIGDKELVLLENLANSTPKTVAISETGLDFMANMPDRAIQYQSFRNQIRLARSLQYPIIFHSRESHKEVLRILREEKAFEVGGAMHYFQSDLYTAEAAINLGFYISLARPLLRLPKLQDVVKQLPLESIVLETDSTPQPFKAKRENWTEPRHVRDVAIKLAEIHNTTLKIVTETTTKNFLEMLGKKREVVDNYIGVAESNPKATQNCKMIG